MTLVCCCDEVMVLRLLVVVLVLVLVLVVDHSKNHRPTTSANVVDSPVRKFQYRVEYMRTDPSWVS